MNTTAPRLLPLIAFTAAYMCAAVAGALISGNTEFIFYIVVMLLLIGVIAWVHHAVRLSAGLLWALSIWGLAHMAGGLLQIPSSWPHVAPHNVLYSLWLIPDLLKYDQIVHAYGFGVTTWLCWQAWSMISARHGSTLRATGGVLLLCAAAGMGFGALNEVVEFIAVLTIPNTNVGGYENTGWDLVANLVGCVIAALLIRLRYGQATST
jgi:uncharacterized membrane protein